MIAHPLPRRNFTAGLALGAISACGGGAGAGPQCSKTLVDCIGDSTFSGLNLIDRPIPRIARQAGVQCINHAIPGWTIANHASTFDVSDSPASVVVMRFGGADTLTLTDQTQFAQALTTQVTQAKAAGKTPVLVGVIRLARKPLEQDAIGIDTAAFEMFDAHSALLDRAIKTVAEQQAARFVDIRALRFDGAIDIADAVHPAQAYSDRCADAIAQALPTLS
jgi:hypothetical protein